MRPIGGNLTDTGVGQEGATGDSGETLSSVFEKCQKDPQDISKLDPELQLYVDHAGALGQWVKHPLYNGPAMPWRLANFQFRAAARAYEEYLAEDRYSSALWVCVNRAWRLHVAAEWYDSGIVDLPWLQSEMAHLWTDVEFPEQHQELPLRLFRECGFVTDDPSWPRTWSAPVELWRGVDGVCELSMRGVSWTTDRRVAEFFATRYAPGNLYRTWHAGPGQALAWLVGRGESELVVDPVTLGDIERVSGELDVHDDPR